MLVLASISNPLPGQQLTPASENQTLDRIFLMPYASTTSRQITRKYFIQGCG
jgi:hypothetical protein